MILVFQVRGVRQAARDSGGPASSLLYDGRQGGQDPGAPGALRRGGQVQRRGGPRRKVALRRVRRKPGSRHQVWRTGTLTSPGN